MPELPEVESVARALRLNLQDRVCTGLRVRFGGVLEPSARAVRQSVVGRPLHAVRRHGKYLVLEFGDGPQRDDPGGAAGAGAAGLRRVMLHLRMTGQVFLLDGYRPDKHVHLTLDFDGRPVHYRDIRKFGRWRVVGPDWRTRELAHIGPDMLAVRFAQWHPVVARRRAPLKSVLLDQGTAAGLGNIYVDEALFRAGLHPLTRPADLPRETLQRVLRESKAVLRLAIRHGGTTFLNFTDFHGEPGNFRRKLRVYGRTGERCRRCGGTIARIVVGGRSAHFCPGCQVRPGDGSSV